MRHSDTYLLIVVCNAVKLGLCKYATGGTDCRLWFLHNFILW